MFRWRHLEIISDVLTLQGLDIMQWLTSHANLISIALKYLNKEQSVTLFLNCFLDVDLMLHRYVNNIIQNKKSKTTLSCNCRYKNGCPLNGNCRTDVYIYIYIYKSRNENVQRHRKMLFQIYTWYKGNVEVKYYNNEKIHKVKL